MGNIRYYGTVATDGSTKITCTTDTLTISKISINNILSNYTISVNLFIQEPLSVTNQIPVYTLNLNMGDNLRDFDGYLLNKGDYIQLITDVAGTKYQINAYSL